jgi:NAD(P)-dependent dehydrogenase (short-subunit alcohol dehydrogenase family)
VTLASGSLHGQRAVVTGAGKGLGRAYALYLASQGARVLVNNRRHAGQSDAQTSAQQTVDAIRAAGGEAYANWCDVSQPDSGLQMQEDLMAKLGGVDIVVANAGIDKASSFAKQSLADFRAVFDTSFFGNLNLLHALWPQLLEQGYGRVILTTSSAGLYANHGQSAYSAAKAAVIGLMRALALEGKRQGVRVNAIAPYGYSQMTAPYMAEGMAELFDPALVAPLVGWLASPACSCSGEVLVSGAGFVRRADTAESAALALDAAQLEAQLAQLHTLPRQAYASASASFAQFLQEIDPTTENT